MDIFNKMYLSPYVSCHEFPLFFVRRTMFKLYQNLNFITFIQILNILLICNTAEQRKSKQTEHSGA